MNSKQSKVICDPVHNLIPFEDTNCDNLLLSLINTKEFQRLRRIKQLGMSELVFPGANHSRFAHSIGVMQMARHFLQRLTILEVSLTEEQKTVVLVAALLHDLGHGPFSHAFEKITQVKHEVWTERIISDSSTEINQCLIKHHPDLPKRLKIFFDVEESVDNDDSQEFSIPSYLTQIVSSQLDADRFDYLLRDSYASGTSGGQFEYSYIIQNLFLDATYHRFFVGRKARLAVEAYLFARYQMYQMVYFHKTTRAAEVMLRLLFKRFKEMLQNGDEPEAIAPNLPPQLITAFQGEIGMEDYLALDDMTVLEFFKSATRSKDMRLQTLATGILNRHLYKAYDISHMDYYQKDRFKKEVTKSLKEAGFDLNYDFEEDTTTDIPYKPYKHQDSKSVKNIYIETPSGVKDIDKESKIVEQLSDESTTLRYYFPEKARDIVVKSAERIIGGG